MTLKSKLFAIMMLAASTSVLAQLNPMGTMYFQNQYLGNPALAGVNGGLDLNLGIRTQWANMPGSPNTQTLTASYALNNKVGLGLNMYNDQSGLFKRVRTVASYAYRLPLNDDDKKLAFGLSLGFSNERIALEEIRGSADDMAVGNYNLRDTYVDGDFGIAYLSTNLSVQAALPNMKGVFKRDQESESVDRETFFSAISYKIRLEGGSGFGLEPKVAYRGVKGMNNIIDAGANLSYENNKINLFGMYHSTNSTTFGIGLNHQTIGFTGMYSTATSALSSYTNGIFEMGLRVRILK